MNKRLYVGNVADDVTEADLHDVFSASGEIAQVRLVLDRGTGQSRGFAFVEMNEESEAERAVEALDGRAFKGRALNVRQAQRRSGLGGPAWGGAADRR
jgi:RNA recognition motif-containing protein